MSQNVSSVAVVIGALRVKRRPKRAQSIQKFLLTTDYYLHILFCILVKNDY